MADPQKRRALGRGLDALLPSGPAEAAQGQSHFTARIEELHPSRQPRTRFDDAALNALAESLKEKGLLAPLLVRRRARGGYEIIAGERRWRAAQRAGVFEVPVIVREMQDGEAFEAALVENLQREDLNPLEVARAFQRLMKEHGHSQDSIAALTGRDRSTVSNSLRLLNLPESVLDLIAGGQLSEGHGRALLTAGDPESMEKLARKALRKGWSVRETERQGRAAAAARTAAGGEKAGRATKSANVRDLEHRLTKALGTRVTVADRNGKGHLTVPFSSYDELDRILDLFLK